MPINTGDLANRMINAGRTLVGEIWERIEMFAIPELRKIATQIEAIGRDIAVHGIDGARILLKMQVDASLGIIAGMTELTLLAVQNAINAILAAVRDFVNGAIGIALL